VQKETGDEREAVSFSCESGTGKTQGLRSRIDSPGIRQKAKQEACHVEFCDRLETRTG
jgi:hypothetical protein